MSKRNIVLGMLLIAYNVGSVLAGDSSIRYRQLSMADYKDKVAGGWIGQAVGVLWGQCTEGKWQGQMVPFDLKDHLYVVSGLSVYSITPLKLYPGQHKECGKPVSALYLLQGHWKTFRNLP